ncbi:ParB/RepB/Spo0J family partition protein [Propylenella binzhouense]|uniref:DNA-binding protein n=1 Tax=Propylenella binzhouense TaxID=2555902 RepID=A0A964T3P6_9HYPH|nr:ParB/RepB/Spo0J family partition protein [Propylenella binzhouense]MYZ47888.1 DNA-binding protein [Propylenella binzhouense]
MAQAAKKIVLSASRDIPFNKLILSQSNVRRVKAGVSIEELAEDIARRGLLQGLSVRPVLDGEGQETGMFEVPAGGRRYRALELLVKQKGLAKTAPVPCVVKTADDGISAEEDSLAENVRRIDLHPLDQFRAFQSLREQGQSEEEVAARFFVTPAVVKQRLRLAAVSPKLLDLYAEDGITLDLLMAFTVTNDHARQEQVWEALARQAYKEPYQVRRMLTEGAVRASDRRAQFVGVAAYEEAGGVVLRDLFQADDGGWLQDPALLDRLVVEKLQAEAQAIAEEGWKWIEVATDFPYGHSSGLRRLRATGPVLTDEEQATYDALQQEYGAIEEQWADSPDDLPDEVDQRLGEIEAALDAIHNRPPSFEPAEVARAGAFVSIDSAGNLKVERGFVRPEDEAPVEPVILAGGTGDEETATASGSDVGTAPAVQRAVITIGGASEPEPEEDEGLKPLPERLMQELTAHRTLALRDAVANDPHVAVTALLHKLVTDTFVRTSTAGGCLEASVRHVFFPAQAADLKDSPSARSVDERQKAWAADMPVGDDQALWDWLDALDEASRLALLAHCVSYGVNALFEKVDRYGGAGLSQHGLERRMRQADRLARAVNLDMAEAGWTPTTENYLGRVTKGRILEAVREAKGEQAAQLIDHLKKGDMAKEAERLLADTGWVPEPLRTPGGPEESVDAGQPEADAAELPAFLADDEDGSAPGEEPEPVHAIAAE